MRVDLSSGKKVGFVKGVRLTEGSVRPGLVFLYLLVVAVPFDTYTQPFRTGKNKPFLCTFFLVDYYVILRRNDYVKVLIIRTP